MRSRFLTVLIILILGVFTIESVAAQACGRGIYTLELYTINGDKEREFEYEILPINPDSLEVIYSLYGFSDKFKYDSYIGTIIQERFTGKLIDQETPEIQEDFEELLKWTGNSAKGKIKNGKIEFSTIETDYTPYLLKITSDKQDLYIVVHLFGGCHRDAIVLWNAHPKIVRK